LEFNNSQFEIHNWKFSKFKIVRILWLKTELLHPIDKGGRIRTYNMLKELKAEHHITYLTLDDGTAAQDARQKSLEYCHELICIPHTQKQKFTPGFYSDLALNLVSPLPYAIQKYSSKAMRAAIQQQLQSGKFDVLVCDFLAPAINVPENLPCPTVLFQHNVEAMIWKRHYEVQTSPPKKAYLHQQWQKMRRFEQKVCGRFDSVVAVSREDVETIHNEYEVSQVFDVPTGVDTEFFRPSGSVQRDPNNLVFTGSMDWLPNEDAIRYFTEEIMPLIKRSVPDVTLTVVGRNPFLSLIELSKREPSIIVTGRVDDVRPYIEKAAAYVVPLRIGSGTRLKIYEAMAMEKPIVSTSVGAEGLPLENNLDLLLADSAQSFAEAVVRILSDQALADRLGQKAGNTVRTNFGWTRVAQRFAEICLQSANRESELVA
jgi:sugar transferase (PEP-CTERM/EpsH1 system associated)